MTNIEKIQWVNKLNKLATSAYGIHHITGHKIENFVYWLEGNEDYKNLNPDDVLKRNTSIQKDFNPEIHNVQILMYIENEFLDVNDANLTIFKAIYEQDSDLS